MSLELIFINAIANTTKLSPQIVNNVLNLLITEKCTVPFVTRYRKEAISGIDEVQIRTIFDLYEAHLETEKRRDFILKTIKEMEKLTPELEKIILGAQTLNQLEDIYTPYKSKKKTKGMIAKEKGLLPLAEILMNSNLSIDEISSKHKAEFVSKENGITDFNEAIEGAKDIIIEIIAQNIDIKNELRDYYWKESLIISSKKKKADEVSDSHKYKDYFEYTEPVKDLKDKKASHRFLAIRRGMNEKVLSVNISFDEDKAIEIIKNFQPIKNNKAYDQIINCYQRAYKNYIHSSLDLEIKSELKKIADEHAIDIFKTNLKNVLLAPYLGSKTILGVDPAVRTGCKLAVIDQTGKYLVDTIIYPHPPQNYKAQSGQIVDALIHQFKIEYIAIGNGTYSRETLSFLEKYVSGVMTGKVKATLTSESGASIYSTSPIARKEFPDKDPTVRSSISIARRFQDPLAELVKLDPKSIGVGQYQHDVNQTMLKKSLGTVVESCVNFVGVDLNTASAPLLSHISGIGPTLADKIISYREDKGRFVSRDDLKKVPRFTDKIFEQAAGFLRIFNSVNPLDSTFIHPEQYKKLQSWAQKNKVNLDDLINNESTISKLASDNELMNTMGEFTLSDIIKSLKAPSQDPRTEFKSTEFRKDLKEIKDVKIGEWYPGIVTNIAQFGAFVDIGIKENGLLHISQMSDHFVENALTELKVGESVKVRIQDIDFERKRISLTRKKTAEEIISSNAQSNRSGTPQQNNKNNHAFKPNKKVDLKNKGFAGLNNFKVK